MTPEERAKAVIAEIRSATIPKIGSPYRELDPAKPIATAIREAVEPYEATLRIIDSALDGIPGESRAEKIRHLRSPINRQLCCFCIEERDDVIQGALGSICPGCVELCVAVIYQRKNPQPEPAEVTALKELVESHLASIVEKKD